MVQTRAAVKKTEPGIVQGNDGSPVPCASNTQLVPVRLQGRKPAAETPKRRRRGKPGELCQLNLDVLFLIAAYVHPIDLLHLARTCRSLRQLLMGKSSEFVWKASRRQVKGLPNCPADLTEPEYANLVFCARCHGCGKYATYILWYLRRRYCPGCRLERLCPGHSCDAIISHNCVLPMEKLTIGDQTTTWADKEQVESFMQEYNRRSDKDQFLEEKETQYLAIDLHARRCVNWKEGVQSERRVALSLRREERKNSISERLILHGFKPEIDYFGWCKIQEAHPSFFKTSKPLKDKDWACMWPKWLETMNDFRSRRLDKTVFLKRRESLVSQYCKYVRHPSPETPSFDILPNAIDLVHFPPFRDVIRAPEETEMGDKPFESAFGQLPHLVCEWRKRLDCELAELVEIPAHLSKSTSKGQAVTSGSKTRLDSSQAATYKLRLACAVFVTDVICTYPEVLYCMRPCIYPTSRKDDSQRTLRIGEQFNIRFLEEAPHIVHACGLDPHVATVGDMDRRNARIKCLVCTATGVRVRSWRDALRHARSHMRHGPLDQSPRWEAIDDKHISAIWAAELSVKKELSPFAFGRCLLCHPRVGDMMIRATLMDHLDNVHSVVQGDVEQDVHYAVLGVHENCSVEMVEEGPTDLGQVVFKDPIYEVSRLT